MDLDKNGFISGPGFFQWNKRSTSMLIQKRIDDFGKVVRNSFILTIWLSIKAKDSASLGFQLLTWAKNPLYLLQSAFFKKGKWTATQLQVVNIMSWGMSKQHSGQDATSKDGGFRKMKSWGILIAKFGWQPSRRPWYSMIFHDIIAAKALREQELDESVDLW